MSLCPLSSRRGTAELVKLENNILILLYKFLILTYSQLWALGLSCVLHQGIVACACCKEYMYF